MRDEQVGEAELALEVLQEVDDLGLDRHVEGRHRLVEDEQPRLQGERPGDADALLLAAGELARVAAGHAGREADHLEQARDVARAAHLLEEPVDAQRLGHDVADGEHRVERRVGVLEHVLDVAADRAHGASAEALDGAALDADAAARRADQAHDRAAVVVLPQPDSPTRLTVSPGRIARLTPSTARTEPTVLRSRPALIGKWTFRVLHLQERRLGGPRGREGAGGRPRDPPVRGGLLREVAGRLLAVADRRATAAPPPRRAPAPPDRAQRGWKGQPEGRSAGVGGWPGIGSSRSPALSMRGALVSSATV